MRFIHPRRCYRKATKAFHDWFFYYLLPDEWEIRYSFKKKFGYGCNLNNPKTFNEKIQWLKLHDRKPLYPLLTDKLLVKDFVAKKIGENHVIPTIAGGFSRFDDIPLDSLPKQFVIKCNHDCMSTIICKDKASFDFDNARIRLEKALKRNYYHYKGKQWAYKDIHPQIFVEQFISGEDGRDLVDYKFHMFNGECKTIFYFTDRFTSGGLRMNCYDPDWNLLPFTRGCPNTDMPIPKPEKLPEMLALAKKLAEIVDNPFIRIDLYCIQDRVYFSEFTFYPADGLEPFNPAEWDNILGGWINLHA